MVLFKLATGKFTASPFPAELVDECMEWLEVLLVQNGKDHRPRPGDRRQPMRVRVIQGISRDRWGPRRSVHGPACSRCVLGS